MVCQHPDKCCDNKHCDSGKIMFLICHVTSSEHIFKGLPNLWMEISHGR